MQFILDLTNILPAQLDFGSALLFLGAFCLGIFALTLVFRLFFGKGSGFSRAISSALGILLVYLATVLIYTFRPGNFARFLSPLPFVTFSADRLILFSFTNAAFPDICRELLSMIVLAFLVNLTDSFIADGKKLLTWLISRFLTVLGAMAVHYGVNVIILNFLPDVLYQYAPMILFCILIFMLSLGRSCSCSPRMYSGDSCSLNSFGSQSTTISLTGTLKSPSKRIQRCSLISSY